MRWRVLVRGAGSRYGDTGLIQAAVDAGRHRNVVGGLWEEVGRLQFEFLKNQGLEPRHRLLDIGCGSLRGGVHFIRYLDPGQYFGVDINESLLTAGYEVELRKAGLQERLPRQNLLCAGDFSLDAMPGCFDFALAQSLFSHLTFDRIRQCLERLAPKMNPGGPILCHVLRVARRPARLRFVSALSRRRDHARRGGSLPLPVRPPQVRQRGFAVGCPLHRPLGSSPRTADGRVRANVGAEPRRRGPAIRRCAGEGTCAAAAAGPPPPPGTVRRRRAPARPRRDR